MNLTFYVASDAPSKVGGVELDVKEDEVKNIKEIVVKLEVKNGTPVEKTISSPTDAKTDLLDPFDDVDFPVVLDRIVVIIKKL